MCKFCDNYNFGGIGFDFVYGEHYPTIFFPVQVNDIKFSDPNSFKFCPVFGKKLGKMNFEMER